MADSEGGGFFLSFFTNGKLDSYAKIYWSLKKRSHINDVVFSNFMARPLVVAGVHKEKMASFVIHGKSRYNLE